MRKFLLNGLLVIGTLVVLIPVSELIVRIARPQSLPSQEFLRGFVLKDMYVPDEAAGYRLAPHFSGRIERNAVVTEFTTNSMGLRADELGEKRRPRILAFGDSFTWGWGVGQGEEWISVVGREIAKKTLDDVDTVNCGVNGYGTANALALLERIAPELEPDLVLLGFFANDFTDNLLGAKGIYSVRGGYLFDHFSHDWYQENFLARESHLYRLVTSAWETLRVTRLGGVPSSRPVHQFSADDFREGAALSERHILAMEEAARAIGARFAVVWLPADVYAVNGSRPEDIPARALLQDRSRRRRRPVDRPASDCDPRARRGGTLSAERRPLLRPRKPGRRKGDRPLDPRGGAVAGEVAGSPGNRGRQGSAFPRPRLPSRTSSDGVKECAVTAKKY